MKKASIAVVLALCSMVSLAQEKGNSVAEKKTSIEVMFNVSSALGKATGNVGSNTFLTDPVIIGAKVVFKDNQKALRLGCNFNIVNTEGNDNSFFFRTSSESFYAIAAGMEKRVKLSPKFQYFYGADILYYNLDSETITFTQDGSGNRVISTIKSVKNGPGAGPVLGFRWDITPRFALITEASFAFQVINTHRYIIESNGYKDVLEDNLQYTARPLAPGAIFLIFRL